MIHQTLHLSLAEYDAQVLQGAFDGPGRCVHILREPEGSLYKSHRVASSPETISPLIAPQAILDLHDLFVGL